MNRRRTYTYSISYNRYDHSMFFIQDSLFRFFIYDSWYKIEYEA